MFIFWILFPSIAADCPVCPTGGIWSEWVTTDPCPTTCGGCTVVNFTRICLSNGIPGCACSGDSKASKPCNTQACNYPRANGPTPPCCNGMTPTIINNWYYCRNGSEPAYSTPCCPAEGIWGEWSKWTKAADKQEYTRSRNCISSGFSCQCVGDYIETVYSCPCAPLVTLVSNFDDPNKPCAQEKTTYQLRQPQYHPALCKATFLFETSDWEHPFYFRSNGTGSQMVTTFGFLNSTGGCELQRYKTYTGTTVTSDGQLYPMEFTCSLETGLWNGFNDYSNQEIKDISAIGQFYVDS